MKRKATRVVNHTKLQTKLLKKVISLAIRRAECEADITAFVDPHSSRLSHAGVAYRGSWVNLNWKSNDRRKNPPKRKVARTNDGYFVIKYATLWNADPFKNALRVYEVAVHEAKHVADFQMGLKFSYSQRYRNRPHEKRANATMAGAIKGLDNAVIGQGTSLDKEALEAVKALGFEIARVQGKVFSAFPEAVINCPCVLTPVGEGHETSPEVETAVSSSC